MNSRKTSAKNSAKASEVTSAASPAKAARGKSARARKAAPEELKTVAAPPQAESAAEVVEAVVDEVVEDVAHTEIVDGVEPEKSEAEVLDEEAETAALPASSGYREFEILFARWQETGDAALRDQLILMYRNLVVSLARRFMERGEMFDDIVQQGMIGLIYALDHFDPSRGVRFTTFATPSILGEIRRYFRDKSWGIRVPRRLQELHQVINRRVEQLTQQYDRAPTYGEIANALNLPVEEVIEVLEMAHAVEPMSLDDQSPGEDGPLSSLGDTIGAADPNLQRWNDYAPLQAALETLPERQRVVLHAIYFEGRSQAEIARELNVSQMYVSRAQRRALQKLKELLREGEA